MYQTIEYVCLWTDGCLLGGPYAGLLMMQTKSMLVPRSYDRPMREKPTSDLKHSTHTSPGELGFLFVHFINNLCALSLGRGDDGCETGTVPSTNALQL